MMPFFDETFCYLLLLLHFVCLNFQNFSYFFWLKISSKTCCLNYDFFEKAKILFGDVLKWGGEGGGLSLLVGEE